MRYFGRDVRYAIRTLCSNRAFTATVILSLGLAVGVTTAVFSFTNAVLLYPLPWRNPNRLVVMWASKVKDMTPGISSPDFRDLRAQNRCFADVVPFQDLGRPASTSGDPGSESVGSFYAGTGLFSLLGVQPYLGRAFRSEDSEPGNDRVAVISYSFWKSRFGGNPKAVGQTLAIGSDRYTVVGVMPPRFFFPYENIQAWLPLSQQMLSGSRGGRSVHLMARLDPGITLAQAQSEVDTIAARLAATYPKADRGLTIGLFPLADQILGSYRAAIWSLFGGVLLLLLIACANVAHLLLARAMRRGPEISVRVTLGATRGAIFRQLLTESLLLGVASGAVGILIAFWGVRILLHQHLADIPRFGEAGINGTALLFALGVSLLSGLLFGVLPALHASRPNLTASLKQGGTSYSHGSHTALRDLLMVSEVAFAFVLIAGAGLLINSFVRLAAIHWGFRPDHVLIVDAGPARTEPLDIPQSIAYVENVIPRLETLPGVLSASVSRGSLIANPEGAPGYELTVGTHHADNVRLSMVGPDYFRTLGIPILRGREFTDADNPVSLRVAVIDRKIAAQLWPAQNPIGKVLEFRTWTKEAWGEIERLAREKKDVGSVWNDPHSMELVPYEVIGEAEPVLTYGIMPIDSSDFYVDYTQRPPSLSMGGSFYLHTSVNPLLVARAAGQIVTSATGENQIADIQTLEQRVQGAIGGHGSNKLLALVSSITGALGLLLAALGIYGVLAYTTALRTREIGIRIALGAQRGHVFRMVLGRGLAVTLAGLLFGFYGAMQTTKALASYLFQIKPMDPVTLIGAAVVFLLAAFLACYIPARRAMRVDPMSALRYE